MNQALSLRQFGLKTWEKIPPAWKFSLLSVTLMRVFYTLWSLIFLSSTFSPVIQNQEFFGEPVITVFDLQTSRAYAYNRLLNGDLLTFQKFDAAHLIDTKTGSIWQVSDGRSVSGSYAGKSLLPAGLNAERLFPYHGVSPYPFPLVAIWQRFDANWYLVIAQKGYGFVSGDVHFPPLYPALIRLFTVIFRNGFVSALLFSQFALYLLVKLLYDLFTEWKTEEVARKALIFLLIFPTSFFFFSGYTEAIFMIFAILCIESIRNGRWHWTGFWIFCAILVRLQGVALLLPFAWRLLQTRFRNVKFVDVFFAGLGPIVAMSTYLLIRAIGEDPSVIPFTETNLHAQIAPPWENLIYSIQFIFDGLAGYIDIFNLVVFILFSMLLVVHWKKIPMEYALFSATSIIVLTMRLVDTQPLNSMIRYLLTVFPIFYLFGMFSANKWVNRLMFVCFLSLNLFLSGQFFLWGWVG
jgi:Predicted integral membrane protein